MRRLRSIGAFWYDFVVGDDWRVAVVVVAALALTAVLVHAAGVNAWWLLPVCVFAALGWSLRRATPDDSSAGAPDQAVVEGEDHGRGAVAQPQLGEHVVDVRLDRALADEQLGGDLAVGLAPADQRQHLELTAGERVQVGVPAGRPAAAGADR